MFTYMGSRINAQKSSIAFDSKESASVSLKKDSCSVYKCIIVHSMEVLPLVKLSTTAHPPSPPRNLTFHFYLDFETNKLRGNATWIGPEIPEGKLIEYRYVLSSVVASTIIEGTISVEVCVGALIQGWY